MVFERCRFSYDDSARLSSFRCGRTRQRWPTLRPFRPSIHVLFTGSGRKGVNSGRASLNSLARARAAYHGYMYPDGLPLPSGGDDDDITWFRLSCFPCRGSPDRRSGQGAQTRRNLTNDPQHWYPSCFCSDSRVAADYVGSHAGNPVCSWSGSPRHDGRSIPAIGAIRRCIDLRGMAAARYPLQLLRHVGNAPW